jgi:hypothetical protein
MEIDHQENPRLPFGRVSSLVPLQIRVVNVGMLQAVVTLMHEATTTGKGRIVPEWMSQPNVVQPAISEEGGVQ